MHRKNAKSSIVRPENWTRRSQLERATNGLFQPLEQRRYAGGQIALTSEGLQLQSRDAITYVVEDGDPTAFRTFGGAVPAGVLGTRQWDGGIGAFDPSGGSSATIDATTQSASVSAGVASASVNQSGEENCSVDAGNQGYAYVYVNAYTDGSYMSAEAAGNDGTAAAGGSLGDPLIGGTVADSESSDDGSAFASLYDGTLGFGVGASSIGNAEAHAADSGTSQTISGESQAGLSTNSLTGSASSSLNRDFATSDFTVLSGTSSTYVDTSGSASADYLTSYESPTSANLSATAQIFPSGSTTSDAIGETTANFIGEPQWKASVHSSGSVGSASGTASVGRGPGGTGNAYTTAQATGRSSTWSDAKFDFGSGAKGHAGTSSTYADWGSADQSATSSSRFIAGADSLTGTSFASASNGGTANPGNDGSFPYGAYGPTALSALHTGTVWEAGNSMEGGVEYNATVPTSGDRSVSTSAYILSSNTTGLIAGNNGGGTGTYVNHNNPAVNGQPTVSSIGINVQTGYGYASTFSAQSEQLATLQSKTLQSLLDTNVTGVADTNSTVLLSTGSGAKLQSEVRAKTASLTLGPGGATTTTGQNVNVDASSGSIDLDTHTTAYADVTSGVATSFTNGELWSQQPITLDSSGHLEVNIGSLQLSLGGSYSMGTEASAKVYFTFTLDTNSDGSPDVTLMTADSGLEFNVSGTNLATGGSFSATDFSLSGNTATLLTHSFATTYTPAGTDTLYVQIRFETKVSAGTTAMSAASTYSI